MEAIFLFEVSLTHLNFPSTDGVDVCAINMPDFRYGGLVMIAFSKNSSVCTPLESTLGVRDTLDLPPLRNIFDMSEFVELLQRIDRLNLKISFAHVANKINCLKCN